MTTLNYNNGGALRNNKPHYSVPSLVAIACALGSFFVGPGLALVLCIVAIIAGLIGVVVSLLPGVRGGMISTLSIVIAVIGIIVGLIRVLTPDRPALTGPTASPAMALPAIVSVY